MGFTLLSCVLLVGLRDFILCDAEGIECKVALQMAVADCSAPSNECIYILCIYLFSISRNLYR